MQPPPPAAQLPAQVQVEPPLLHFEVLPLAPERESAAASAYTQASAESKPSFKIKRFT